MRLTLFFAIAAFAAACTPAANTDPVAESGVVAASATEPACFKRSSDQIGGPFHLTSHTGSPTTEASFRGQKTLVFFGFTHCPDVCPTTLYGLGKAIGLLPPGKTPPKTAFISVDPARDTPEAITQYIQSNGFPQDIIGLTGTLDELQQVADAFAAPFSRDEDTDSAAGYVVSHSSILYLMDENWKLRTFFTADETPQEIASCLAALG